MLGGKAHPFAFDLSTRFPGVSGPLCLSYPAMCATLAAGATVLRGIESIDVSP